MHEPLIPYSVPDSTPERISRDIFKNCEDLANNQGGDTVCWYMLYLLMWIVRLLVWREHRSSSVASSGNLEFIKEMIEKSNRSKL